MKLRAIELEGFQSYRQRERVDLAGLNLTAVVGANHVGKSTLISDAVTFAFYGKGRGSVVGDVISRGEQRTEVAVEFDLNGNTYKIARARTRKGRHEVFVGVSDPDTPNGWRELTEKNSLHADAFIVDLLGMDAPTARATWMIAQNDFGSFCEMQPSPRRNVLAAAFGLDRFADLARRAEEHHRAATLALEKATYDHDSLVKRQEALNIAGPFPSLDDDELTNLGHEQESRAEKAAQAFANLDDPELESRAQEAQRAHRDYLAAHEENLRRYHREIARLQGAVADAEKTVTATSAARDRAQEAVWEIDDANQAVKEAAAAVERQERALGTLRSEHQRLASIPAVLESERASILARGTEIAERLKSLEASVHTDDGTCFACGQGLTPDQANELLTQQRTERDSLKAAYDTKGADHTAATSAAEAAARKITEAERSLAGARSSERAAEKAAEQVVRLADTVDAEEASASDAVKRLAQVQRDLSDLGEEPRLDQARADGLKATADAAVNAFEQARGGQHRKAELQQIRDEARSKSRAVWQEQERRARTAAERAALEDPLAKAQAAVERHSKDQETFAVLHESFKPSGIPAMILAGVVEELNDEANDILGGLGNDGLGIVVSTHREKARGGVEEKVMIYATTADGQADYSTLSGSEKFRVALALRLGLARCIARRTGSPMETIVMDEGWGALDEQTKHAVQEVLGHLSTEFAIFTVSHVEDVRDAFPNLIEVSADAGTSRASVVAR